MSIFFRNIQTPIFITIEKNCLSKLRRILRAHHLEFNNPIIISEQNIIDNGGKKIINQFKKKFLCLTNNNSISETEKIIKKIKQNYNDVVIGLGGGRILDIGKYTATKAKLNYISIPTTASHDGIASPIAVLKNNNDITESLGVNMPVGILVDLNIIKNSPRQCVISGVGDLLSNFSAIEDWKLAARDKNEILDGFAASLSYAGADLIYANYKNCDKININSEKFLNNLVLGLIMSGIAMNITGNSRPCSGAEHEISHAIDALYPGTASHGEQVSLGIVLANKIRSKEDLKLNDFLKKLGLPTSYNDLKLTKDQIVKAIKFAPKTRPDRYTILEKKKLSEKQIEKII